jgi:hypothetical protein
MVSGGMNIVIAMNRSFDNSKLYECYSSPLKRDVTVVVPLCDNCHERGYERRRLTCPMWLG